MAYRPLTVAAFRDVMFIVLSISIGCAIVMAADPPGPIGVTIPDVWKRPPAGPLTVEEGVVWFRGVVVPPKGWEGQGAELFVEAVDDARQVYLNGELIGGSDILIEMYNSGELRDKLTVALAS